MRFHVLGLPHTVTSPEYVACAYTQKALKFCKMMTKRGHQVIHYGHEDSVVDAEHVTVITNKDLEIAYGNYDWRKTFFRYDTTDHAYQTFYKNAIAEIEKRKQKNDFILPFWGAGVRPICDAHPDLITVEPGIGYAGGHWARFKIFESYAIMHAYYGLKSVGQCIQDWYDVVIPNYFDPDDFEFKENKKDYFLFLGRVYEGKGIHIAIQATKEIGAKLVVAGQSNLQEAGYTETPSHVEFVGYADTAKRKELMANAKGAFVASLYNEPFGGVQVECLFSGTPTITTDWGAFTENNVHGLTGYRCRTFDHFVWAAKNIERINPKNCRDYAMNFTMDKVAAMYEEYFQNVLNVYTGNGWYEPNPRRIDLDYLKKDYPHHQERCDYITINTEEAPFAERLSQWISTNVAALTVLDIGCGPGTYVKYLRDRGITARGIDIDTRIDNVPNLENKSMFELDDSYNSDLVICMEVAEHIQEERADEVVDAVTSRIKENGTLIWTAAIPGQGGIGHINCQPKEYWKTKIENSGCVYDAETTERLVSNMKQGVHMGWFVNNCMVFRKA